MTYCDTCGNKFSDICGGCESLDGVPIKYSPGTLMYKTARTNADKIRNMTDEELADEILKWFNWLNAVEWDDKRIIEWLKQETD